VDATTTERVVAMFILGTSVQACHSMPGKIAGMVSSDLRSGSNEVGPRGGLVRARGQGDTISSGI